MAISHATCTHPRTPAGRRACRAAQANADRHIATETGEVTNRRRAGMDMREIRGRARTAGRDAQIAAKLRIQPRRSGARVSAAGSTCVQAALHIDAHGGKCACGWAAVA